MKKSRMLRCLCSLAILGCLSSWTLAATKDDTSNEVALGQVAGLIIYAADVERSIKFYSEFFGLKTVGRVDKNGELVEVLLSSSGKFMDGMMLTLQPSKRQGEEGAVNPAGFGQIMFMASSNKSLEGRLRDAGYPVNVRDAQHLITTDPDGYQILSYELDPRVLNPGKVK